MIYLHEVPESLTDLESFKKGYKPIFIIPTNHDLSKVFLMTFPHIIPGIIDIINPSLNKFFKEAGTVKIQDTGCIFSFDHYTHNYTIILECQLNSTFENAQELRIRIDYFPGKKNSYLVSITRPSNSLGDEITEGLSHQKQQAMLSLSGIVKGAEWEPLMKTFENAKQNKTLAGFTEITVSPKPAASSLKSKPLTVVMDQENLLKIPEGLLELSNFFSKLDVTLKVDCDDSLETVFENYIFTQLPNLLDKQVWEWSSFPPVGIGSAHCDEENKKFAAIIQQKIGNTRAPFAVITLEDLGVIEERRAVQFTGAKPIKSTGI